MMRFAKFMLFAGRHRCGLGPLLSAARRPKRQRNQRTSFLQRHLPSMPHEGSSRRRTHAHEQNHGAMAGLLRRGNSQPRQRAANQIHACGPIARCFCLPHQSRSGLATTGDLRQVRPGPWRARCKATLRSRFLREENRNDSSVERSQRGSPTQSELCLHRSLDVLLCAVVAWPKVRRRHEHAECTCANPRSSPILRSCLKDEAGQNVLTSGKPISTRQTCGGTATTTNLSLIAFISSRARTRWIGPCSSSHGAPPFNTSPGMFGKFSIIPNRQLTAGRHKRPLGRRYESTRVADEVWRVPHRRRDLGVRLARAPLS